MTNVRVLVSDKLSEAGLTVLREAPDVELEYRPGMSEDELCGVIGDFDGLIIRSATQVTPKVIEAATKVVIVTELTLPGLRDTIRLLANVEDVAPKTPVVVVANRAGGASQAMPIADNTKVI